MNTNFSDNLRRLRISKGYTQEQAAEIFKVSPQSVSRWECGNSFPDVMLLPEIAQLYCVTIDDLYQEHTSAYKNYAERLAAVYEHSNALEDFVRADAEYSKLIKSGQYTMNDLRMYGCLYQQNMNCSKDKALSLFNQALSMDAESDDNMYYQVKRQKMYLLSQIGKNRQIIDDQKKLLENAPDNPHEYVGMVMAYSLAGKYSDAYQFFETAIQKFPDTALLFVYGGDACKNLKKYDEAFKYWQKALELDNGIYDAKYSMGFCYEELGDYGKAYDMWLSIARGLEKDGYEEEKKFPLELAEKCRNRLNQNSP